MASTRRVRSSGASQGASSWEDADDAMEDGIAAEERGERAAFGEKAIRNYQEATRCYEAAIAMTSGPEQAADPAYNAARVLYILATSFYMPQQALETLRVAADHYRKASAGTGFNADSPSTFALDVASNWASAIEAQVELISSMGNASNSATISREVLRMTSEAVGLLEGVAAEQERVLSRQLQDEVAALKGDTTAEMASHESVGAVPAPQPSLDEATEYSSSLIVPSSLMDTYSSLYGLTSGLFAHASSLQDVEQTSQRLHSISDRASAFVASCQEANDWGSRASPDDDWDNDCSAFQRLVTEAEVNTVVEMSSYSDVTEEALRLGQARLTSLQAYIGSKTTLGSEAAQLPESRRRTFYQRKIEDMRQCCDEAITLSRLLLKTALLKSSDVGKGDSAAASSMLRTSFVLATTSSQLYLFILSLLESTSAATVLGSAQSVTPTSLQRCSLLCSLSDVNLLRAHCAFCTLKSPAVVNDVSRTTMLDNGRVYARRALGEVGLAWVLDAAAAGAPTSLDTARLLKDKSQTTPPKGFEAIEIQSQAILTAARASWLRVTFRPTAASGEPASSQREIETLASVARFLRSGGNISGKPLTCTEGWCLALDPTRWWETLCDEEWAQDTMTDEEKAFWGQWGENTRCKVE